MGTLTAWLGSGGECVDIKEAERRAAICAVCPKNHRTEGWLLGLFTRPAIRGIRMQLERKCDMRLETSLDPLLGLCTACFCVLILKVWTPPEMILKHLKPKTKAKLHPDCWIHRL